MRTESIAAALGALVLVAAPISTQAVFHFMKVVEVFPGTAAAPAAQYVVIQMYASGQQFVGGHAITVFDSAGATVATFTFPRNVFNGADQAKILIATSEAERFFCLSADLTMSPSILAAGGKVCFANTIDCVAWGAYSGSPAGVGAPFNAIGGLLSGTAAIRRLDITGSATVLDAADDTDNSANDFVSGLPAPRNNVGVLGTIPGAACGNAMLEGLEQCDDGNLVPGDGCSSTCTVESDRRRTGDYDGDGESDILWRNISTGANTIWRSGSASMGLAMAIVRDQSWQVVGRGDFNGDRRSDVLWRNSSTGANTIWISANASTQQRVTGVTNQSWKVAGIGDFDGDGTSDILWRNITTGANTIWRSARASTQQPVRGVTNQAWKIVGIGDFDGDSKSDVFWRNIVTGTNTIWTSANAFTQQPVTRVTNQAWKVVGIGDFNGDGESDVFWRNITTGTNTIWNSANASTPQPVAGVANQAWAVVGIGDFDGDGRSDVLWRSSSSGSNSIWRSASASMRQAVARVANLSWTVVPYEGQALK